MDLLIDHHDVGFEERFEGNDGGRERGEEREGKGLEETLVSSHEGIVLDPVLKTRTLTAVCCLGTARNSSHQKEKDASQSVDQHDDYEEDAQDSSPKGEYPNLVLEESVGREPMGSLLPGSFLEHKLHKQDPVLGSLGGRSTRSY